MQPFDWERLFIGDNTPWSYLFEVLFRTAVMYIIMVVFFKLAGRKEMKQLTIYDLLLIVGLGSAAGDPMFYEDVPLLHALMVFTGVFLLYMLVNKVTQIHPKAYQWLDGKADCIMQDNIINYNALHKEGMTEEDLYSDLRILHVSHLGQVKIIYLEHSGEFSVFFRTPEETIYGLSLWPEDFRNPHKDISLPGYYSCIKCGYTHHFGHATAKATCKNCNRQEWIKSSDEKRIS